MFDRDIRDALNLMRPHLVGQPISRILLDYQVTLLLGQDQTSRAELKFELPFTLRLVGSPEMAVDPARLGPERLGIWHLFMRVIQDVAISDACALSLILDDGGGLIAPPGGLESWSFVAGQARVVCLSQSNGLAVWSDSDAMPALD